MGRCSVRRLLECAFLLWRLWNEHVAQEHQLKHLHRRERAQRNAWERGFARVGGNADLATARGALKAWRMQTIATRTLSQANAFLYDVARTARASASTSAGMIVAATGSYERCNRLAVTLDAQ